MKRFSIIIQGEGRGHVSQALSLIDALKEKDITPERVYIGRSPFKKDTGYTKGRFHSGTTCFYSPGFLHNSSRKGIQLTTSMILNIMLIPLYVFEVTRLGIMLLTDRSDVVVNFYDPIGALAGKYWKRRKLRVIISHHFYLSHPDFNHPHGMDSSYFWLAWMNRIMIGSASKVFALSFRQGDKVRKTEVIPPLIDPAIKKSIYHAGERDLCYFLNPGFVRDMFNYYRAHPELEGDIFTDTPPGDPVPSNVRLHHPEREPFVEAMLKCKRIIATAGFDTVAEAFYLGIPILLIPSENHYEQYCNALDAARTHMAFQIEEMEDLHQIDFTPVANSSFKNWVITHDILKIFPWNSIEKQGN